MASAGSVISGFRAQAVQANPQKTHDNASKETVRNMALVLWVGKMVDGEGWVATMSMAGRWDRVKHPNK
jgi:hypothetical protein